MKLTRVGLCVGLSISASTVFAAAADLEGVIQVAGSALNVEVMVAPPKANTGPLLCMDDMASRIRRLGGMTVKVTGEWVLRQDGSRDCLKATGFAVLKTSSGGDAVVGMISVKGPVVQVTDAGGKALTLSDAPDGLKKLNGQKAILEVSPLKGPAAKAGTVRVVSYASHP